MVGGGEKRWMSRGIPNDRGRGRRAWDREWEDVCMMDRGIGGGGGVNCVVNVGN